MKPSSNFLFTVMGYPWLLLKPSGTQFQDDEKKKFLCLFNLVKSLS